MLYFSNLTKICCLLSPFFLLIITGCAGNHTVTPEEIRTAGIKTQKIVDRFGLIEDEFTNEFLDYMELRLANSLPKNRRRGLNFDFALINTKAPLALSPGAGKILISKGLITRLQSEAELAFVLAHELAHQHLGHTRPEVTEDFELGQDSNVIRVFELEADKYALGHMALAGYDPRTSIGALLHSYGRARSDEQHVSHPDLWTRIDQLKLALLKSDWTPPGTVNRRAYNQFRRYVHGQS